LSRIRSRQVPDTVASTKGTGGKSSKTSIRGYLEWVFVCGIVALPHPVIMRVCMACREEAKG
jgi:hypothetical protein